MKKKLSKYYGGLESDYNFLKFMNIKKATISQPPGCFNYDIFKKDGIILAGDYTMNGSIEGAVLSGIRASELLND